MLSYITSILFKWVQMSKSIYREYIKIIAYWPHKGKMKYQESIIENCTKEKYTQCLKAERI